MELKTDCAGLFAAADGDEVKVKKEAEEGEAAAMAAEATAEGPLPCANGNSMDGSLLLVPKSMLTQEAAARCKNEERDAKVEAKEVSQVEKLTDEER